MEKHRVRKFIIRGVIFCVLAWVVFSLIYSNWETKRLKEAIGPPPRFSPPVSEDATAPLQTEPEQFAETHIGNDDAEAIAEENQDSETDTAPFAPHVHPHPGDHTHSSPDSEEVLEVPPEFAHLDPYVVKDGYAEYNRYRHSDPERAYEALDGAFRYMFGDLPEVDTMVGFVRKANQGPLTYDEVMDLTYTHIQLLPAFMSDSVNLLYSQIDQLEELKADAIASGVPEAEMVIEYSFNFVDH